MLPPVQMVNVLKFRTLFSFYFQIKCGLSGLESQNTFQNNRFGLILYVPVDIFSVMSGRVFLGLTSTKQRIKCFAQGHNTVPPVTQSRVKHSS